MIVRNYIDKVSSGVGSIVKYELENQERVLMALESYYPELASIATEISVFYSMKGEFRPIYFDIDENKSRVVIFIDEDEDTATAYLDFNDVEALELVMEAGIERTVNYSTLEKEIAHLLEWMQKGYSYNIKHFYGTDPSINFFTDTGKMIKREALSTLKGESESSLGGINDYLINGIKRLEIVKSKGKAYATKELLVQDWEMYLMRRQQ